MKSKRVGQGRVYIFKISEGSGGDLVTLLRYLYTGLALGPFTSILDMRLKEAPREAAKALMSASLPGSWYPNWLDGKATILRPCALYFLWRATISA